MRYQAGAVRAGAIGAIGALDKHDNKESRQVRLRWRVESAMTESITDVVESRASERASERGVARAVHRRRQILYIGHVDNRPVHRWVIEGCMRGWKEGDVKLARGQTKATRGPARRINESIGN